MIRREKIPTRALLICAASLTTVATAYSATAPRVTVSATPSTLSLGQSTVLKWSATNATSCNWFAGTLPGPSGSTVQFPQQSAAYTFTCSGPGGSSSATARVTVGTTGTPPTPTPAPASSIAIAASSYTVDQKLGSVTIIVNRAGTAAGSVRYSTASGSAVGGKDYAIRQGTLTWTRGSTAGKTVSIPIKTAPFTGTRSFAFKISGPSSGIKLGSPTSTTITVRGSGSASSTPGSVALSAASYSVTQPAASLSISVKRSGTGAVSVSYATTNGTAKAGTDYTAKTGTLNWAAGDTATKSFAIAIGNTPFSGSRTFTVKLAAGSGGVALGTPGSANVTITGTGSSTGTPLACSTSKPVWQTCDNWAMQTYANGKYYVRNNIWGQGSPGAGSQCMWVNSESCWGVTAAHADGNGIAKGYPQTVRGFAVGDGFKTANHGLGIAVTGLTKARIHWKMNAPTSGRFQALWDIYFHNKANPAGSESIHTSLMINQRIVDNGYYAAVIAQNCPNAETIAGQQFHVCVSKESWATGNTIQLFKAPISGTIFGSEDMTLDLKAVIDVLRSRGLIPATDYLTGIQIGWEIIDGGTFETNEYWTAVQNEPDPTN